MSSFQRTVAALLPAEMGGAGLRLDVPTGVLTLQSPTATFAILGATTCSAPLGLAYVAGSRDPTAVVAEATAPTVEDNPQHGRFQIVMSQPSVFFTPSSSTSACTGQQCVAAATATKNRHLIRPNIVHKDDPENGRLLWQTSYDDYLRRKRTAEMCGRDVISKTMVNKTHMPFACISVATNRSDGTASTNTITTRNHRHHYY